MARRPNKKVRLNSIDVDQVVETHSPMQWRVYENVVLFEEDKLLLLNGAPLTDNHVNFAQAILKTQFTHLTGLNLTYLQSTSWA